jgi:hypothetical protein
MFHGFKHFSLYFLADYYYFQNSDSVVVKHQLPDSKITGSRRTHEFSRNFTSLIYP